MRLLVTQLVLCVLISTGVLVFTGEQQAMSVLCGGLVAIIPSAFFAIKLFQYQGAKAAKLIIKNFYIGEFLKILLSILLFSLVFIYCKVIPIVFFLTYIAIIMTHWLAPLFITVKK